MLCAKFDALAAWRLPTLAMRQAALTLLFALLLAVPTHASAANVNFNLDSDGYAIERYDPVAYFTEGRAVPGKTAFSVEHDGAKYAFASAEHRRIFLRDPNRYVPQYGGHCAYGAVYGSKSAIDPELWDIVDDRLYLLITPGTMTLWQKRKDIYIKIADRAWLKLTGNSP